MRVAANKEATEPFVPFGKVEVINITVATVTWLTVMEYLSQMTTGMFHLS